MTEVPVLFLAIDCSSVGEARPYDLSDTDRLSFTPGLLALDLLCGIVTGSQLAFLSPNAALRSWVYVDGPPDPDIDEGFQLYRVKAEVARKLSELSHEEVAATAEDLLRELQRDGAAWHAQTWHERPALMAAITQLAELARRGQIAGKPLFVTVLFR